MPYAPKVKPDDTAAASPRPLAATVLTGFLGAGKTTCLNAWLARPEAAGTAVLVNEFGEIDVDGAVLAGRLADGSDLVRLPNGCVCCTVQEDLAAALLALAERGVARCVIETTGLAEPGAILRGLQHDPRLRRVVARGPVVTVCASDCVVRQTDRFPVAARQVALADRLVLSKTDLATPEAVDAARETLRALNPMAEFAAAGDQAAVFAPAATDRPRPLPTAGHAHSHGIANFAIALEAPLDPDLFRDAMSFLILRHADNLLRAKGLLRFAGNPRPQLFNLVHDVWQARPCDAAAPAGIVFIGQNLPEVEIRADLGACQVAEAPTKTT